MNFPTFWICLLIRFNPDLVIFTHLLIDVFIFLFIVNFQKEFSDWVAMFNIHIVLFPVSQIVAISIINYYHNKNELDTGILEFRSCLGGFFTS